MTVGRFSINGNSGDGASTRVRWGYLTSSDRPSVWAEIQTDGAYLIGLRVDPATDTRVVRL